MENTITERMDYLENQANYFKSVSNFEKEEQFRSVINELNFWKEKYEKIIPEEEKDTPMYLIKEKPENNLDNAKKYLLETNFEFFTQSEQNVIGKTMVAYANYIKAE
jgi:hypothetical protein